MDGRTKSVGGVAAAQRYNGAELVSLSEFVAHSRLHMATNDDWLPFANGARDSICRATLASKGSEFFAHALEAYGLKQD